MGMRLNSRLYESFWIFGERPEVKNLRLKNKYIYLFHGSIKDKETIIKSGGLSVNPSTTLTDVRLKKINRGNAIWMSSMKSYANLYIKGPSSNSKPGILCLCKVFTKDLFFVERLHFDEYAYFSKIPLRDIVFATDKNFNKIIRENSYLR